MSIRQIDVTIAGKTPILMHRFPLDPVEAIEKKTPAEQAEIAAYRRDNGDLYIPGVSLQRAFVSGATYCKGKGRASLQKPASACLMVTPEYLDLGTKRYEIDARAVVNPSTKGRIVRYRPRLDNWTVNFALEYDDVLLTEGQVRGIVDATGDRVGVLDFRPERKGSFGRFMVTHWALN